MRLYPTIDIFDIILLGRSHAKCNLIVLKLISTSQKPIENTIKSKYGKINLTPSSETLSQSCILLLRPCATISLNFFCSSEKCKPHSELLLNNFEKRRKSRQSLNAYTCIYMYQQLHDFKTEYLSYLKYLKNFPY